MRIFYEESFGPVTSIIKARDAADAVRLCNDNEYGLSSSPSDQRPLKGHGAVP